MSFQEPILSVKNLYKKFPPSFIAVDGISFDVQPGQILGFLGPNGAGKTTTIQMLLGTMTPTSGQIIYFGKDFGKNRSEILQKVGFASTYVSLPGKLTVYENLLFYGQLYGVQRETLKKRLETLLKRFDMWDIRDKRAATLSAGQMTRVMLIKAFCIYPRIMLLDEPTASLDPDVCQEVLAFIKDQQQQHGVSILFTSHKMDEVAQICDQVLVLKNGSIIAHDTPDRLAAQVSHAKVELVMHDREKVERFCSQQGYMCSISGTLISVSLPEHAIAAFLIKLAQDGVTYDQISIEKPTLEDYFLQITKKDSGTLP